ncbi:MAG TPA: family 16 glycoside hydrolase [Bacteroidales bacterium]|nr:family 16 glycoside hydrolase [Bacteroidales bacterium]
MKKLVIALLLMTFSWNGFAQKVDKIDSFAGDWQVKGGTYFAQVYLSKEGNYKVNLTTDLTSRNAPEAVLDGTKSDGNQLILRGEGWEGKIEKGNLHIEKAGKVLDMKHFYRRSPTMNAAPPKNAIVLFNGKNLDAWTKVLEKDWLTGGTPVDNWKILPGGILQVEPHPAGQYESVITKQKFGDVKIHLEFRLLGEVTNGGVYLQSRYELNIKDAYGAVGGTPIGFGNISDPKDLYPAVNPAFPPMEWQTFDIDFRAPRFDATGTKKTENARITVVHNGVTIYENVELKGVKGSTGRLGEAGVGPIYLQEHGASYQFRNIWVIDKTLKGTEAYQTKVDETTVETDNSTEVKKSGTKTGGKKTGGKNGGGKKIESTYAEESNPAYAATTVQLTAFPGQEPAPSAGFTHPGVLLNLDQLNEIKNRVANGVEPQKTAFEKMKASTLGAIDYAADPVEIVSCGPRSNPDLGCKVEQADCAAAYTQALLWYITGNKVYAENAIKIMNAWSTTLVEGHNYANGPIQAAWCGSVWPRAAEIIRYTYKGWSGADILKFQNFLRTQYLPSIIHGNCENGNKELAMCEALINIGVFNDDRAVFDLGLKMWRGRTPAYIYLKSDGPTPIEPPGCGTAIWGNKGLTPEFVDGLLQETARDTHHAWMAFASMTNGAETAYQQGVDLYAEQGKRMMAALEFEAQYLSPNNVPAPANLQFALNPTWEIAYNHFHNRMGFSLPKMALVIPTNRPTDANHHMVWETLTHGEMGAVGIQKKTTSGIKVALESYSFAKLLNDRIKDESKGISLFDFLEFSANNNFDAVNLTGYYFPGYPNVPSDEYIASIRKKAADLGLDICGTGVRNDFGNPDPEKRAADVKLVKDWIDVAVKLGAPVVRIFSGALPVGYENKWDEVARYMAASIKECADYAKTKGIKLAIQNHGDFLKTADETIKLLKMIHASNVGLTVDTGYFLTEDPYVDIAKVMPYAVNFLLKERTVPTSSNENIDLKKIMKILKDSGFRGYMPIETLSTKTPSKDNAQPNQTKTLYDPFTVVPAFLKEVRSAMNVAFN